MGEITRIPYRLKQTIVQVMQNTPVYEVCYLILVVVGKHEHGRRNSLTLHPESRVSQPRRYTASPTVRKRSLEIDTYPISTNVCPTDKHTSYIGLKCLTYRTTS